MNYVAHVAELFRSRCGDTKILGSMDYVIIAEWEKQEIPLDVVSSAIDQTLQYLGDANPSIDSVSTFQEKVKQNFNAWLQNGTGSL